MLKFYLNLPPKMPWTLLESNFYQYQKSFKKLLDVNVLCILIFVYIFSVKTTHCTISNSINQDGNFEQQEQIVFEANVVNSNDLEEPNSLPKNGNLSLVKSKYCE